MAGYDISELSVIILRRGEYPMKAEKTEQKMKTNSEKSLIHSFDTLLIMAVLKLYTGEHRALSISEITRELNDTFANVTDNDTGLFAERTLYRKVDLLALASDGMNDMAEYIHRMLLLLTGGTVRYRSAAGIASGVNTTGKGSQRRYYFEPLLTNSDLDMISSSLMSSRYLSDHEKGYLLSRLKVLRSEYDESDIEQINLSLFSHLTTEKKSSSTCYSLPSETSVMLSHIKNIYEAIQDEHRIEVIYGMYDIRERTGRLDFHPRNADKPYILNPYAMIWNDGEYYMIATHKDYDNPVHFRIDRIIDVKIHTVEKKDKNGNVICIPEKRNRIPDTLTPFFHRRGKLKVFDAIAYTNTYPDMKIYGRQDLVECCFECTTISIQILIDNFGSNIRLGETPISHSVDDVDINGRPKRYLTATVSGIQRENAIEFAVVHSDSLTLLAPSDIVNEVRRRLKEIYEKYQNIP
ncbi:MAG: WYL domain-containing protein [Lachnospiraceae bacterium]|nr:WYL domain-containing protein [Lachnospiraceae bacterium]